ncbi:hypothetical protein BC939DRAFT_446341 [Gamsiella multidivaricata]|uniref:uncharacterized protein n=1 Tax=Gamsiella multidivaricata TaxID=101098 RepID=UPI00221F7553|nr:uncharacterized protein BC939DRAFT_446341 [Gamsiella multidivaricata]KAI7826961.1 hypothetical protein BC939DRAFT_446341 [Gamsiella multidivaricata]
MTKPARVEVSSENCPSQAFRTSPSSNTSSTLSGTWIGTHYDRTTTRYVIFWEDIQRVFKNVRHIMQGKSIVPFMTDSNFQELTPPRILYRRRVVLDVVLKDTDNGSMSKRQDPVLHSTNAQQDLPKANGNGKANSMDKGHLAPDVKDDLQSTLRSYNQLFRSFCDTMMSDNLTQAKTTMETMRRDLTTIQTTLTKTQPPQELVLKAQRHILENQQNLLEHLSAVQGLLRTVVDRTYELMEDLSHNSNITQSAALAMNSLEIRSHVIQFLDLKDLVRCMRLNKAWHKLIVPRVWKSVRLSSNPHCCPSREAIRCHNHLIKSLEIPYPDEIAVEYYALSFPKLQKLNLTLPRQGVGSMIDAIYCWTHLRELNMRCANTEASLGFDISRLWRTVASLPNLRTLRLRDIEVCNIAVTFSSLRALKLQYTFSCPDTPSQQQAFLSHCPSLMFLEWSAAHTVHWDQTIAAKDFVRRVTARTWPILEGLSLGWNVLGLSDADIASILTVMARVSVLKVPHSDFGPLSFQGLRAHFSTLKELDLSGCFDVTQAMLLEILDLCPRLFKSCRERLVLGAADISASRCSSTQ